MVNALLLAVRGNGPHPDSHGHREKTSNKCFHHLLLFLLQQHCQKAIPWDTPWRCPTPGCQRCWTSPRWSWTSGNNLKQLFSSSTITSVTTILSKSHSLGHPLVNVLLLAVGCAGPHPDVHGHPETTKNNYTHYEQQLLFGKLYSKLPSIGLLIEKYLKCSIGVKI